MHSFAFAQSGSKWLFVGGRTNGLHGFSTNDSFDVIYASDVITVIDTATWSWYSSPLGVLPTAVADPLRTTNMQYTRIGDYLYLTGGFGWDSIANGFRTFPTLTAIHIDNMINAVVYGTPIALNIRQIYDTNFRISGGEMQQMNGECFLFFGHNFSGRYSDPPQPTFTQVYSPQIKRFTINDDGIPMSFPPAAYAATTYMKKFNTTQAGIEAWTISAGINNGQVIGVGDTEMDFNNDQLLDMAEMGANPFVKKKDVGICINTEYTAKRYPYSSLSVTHSRELLIDLENRLYDMLLRYQWKFNTAEIRAEIKYKADKICKDLQERDGIYDFQNIIDETNNTNYIIGLDMGVLDTKIEIIKGMGVIVNNITILKKGSIQSGGFQ